MKRITTISILVIAISFRIVIANEEGAESKLFELVINGDLAALKALSPQIEEFNQSFLNQCWLLSFKSNNNEISEWLINIGADKNCTNELGENALFYAIDSKLPGRALRIRRAITFGLSPDSTDSSGASLIHVAVSRSQIDSVAELASSGAKIDIKDANGETPISLAAKYGMKDIVAIFLSFGSEFSSTNRAGRNPLDNAASLVPEDPILAFPYRSEAERKETLRMLKEAMSLK